MCYRHLPRDFLTGESGRGIVSTNKVRALQTGVAWHRCDRLASAFPLWLAVSRMENPYR